MLAAGLWAGLLWGLDGRLPLLIAGAVGAVCGVVLLGVAAGSRRRPLPSAACVMTRWETMTSRVVLSSCAILFAIGVGPASHVQCG